MDKKGLEMFLELWKIWGNIPVEEAWQRVGAFVEFDYLPRKLHDDVALEFM